MCHKSSQTKNQKDQDFRIQIAPIFLQNSRADHKRIDKKTSTIKSSKMMLKYKIRLDLAIQFPNKKGKKNYALTDQANHTDSKSSQINQIFLKRMVRNTRKTEIHTINHVIKQKPEDTSESFNKSHHIQLKQHYSGSKITTFQQGVKHKT